MSSCRFIPHTLYFYKPAGTSRGILYEKLSYFLEWTISEEEVYYGECGLLKGLSVDDKPEYEMVLNQVCDAIEFESTEYLDLTSWPSIQCGLEILMNARKNKSNSLIFNNAFYNEGARIPINGLIWMGNPEFMVEQIHKKIDQGFRCIKMKVGALDWDQEMKILQELRTAGGEDLIIRVDANGAWEYNDSTKEKMQFLYNLNVHSIEQPIGVNNHEDLSNLIEWSPIDIALDEELFHCQDRTSRTKLLDDLKPEFIVLKPSLVGGFSACDEWIELCKERNIQYWLTSALESNIALNAICQYSYDHAGTFYQGLGTGSLYENNIDSPLEIMGDSIRFNKSLSWNYKPFL